jgi:hypothetical protein
MCCRDRTCQWRMQRRRQWPDDWNRHDCAGAQYPQGQTGRAGSLLVCLIALHVRTDRCANNSTCRRCASLTFLCKIRPHLFRQGRVMEVCATPDHTASHYAHTHAAHQHVHLQCVRYQHAIDCRCRYCFRSYEETLNVSSEQTLCASLRPICCCMQCATLPTGHYIFFRYVVRARVVRPMHLETLLCAMLSTFGELPLVGLSRRFTRGASLG